MDEFCNELFPDLDVSDIKSNKDSIKLSDAELLIKHKRYHINNEY